MRNLTNTGGDIFVNTMFGQGEAIEIVQQSFNTQALVNVAMKNGTTQATSLNDTDILIIADGATGKVIQYITVADFKTAGTLWELNGNQLYPDSQNYNVVIGTSNGSNPNGYGVLVLDKDIAIQTSAGSGSSNGLRIINDTFSVINYVDNAGDMFWAGATNDYNFDKQLVINTTGAELSNGTNTYTLPSSNGTLALTSDIGTGEWTLSSGNLYPNATATDVIIGGTTNTNNRKLLVNGDADITGNLYFNNDDIYIDSNSQNLRNYAGYTAGVVGAQHLFYVKQSNNVRAEVGSIGTGRISNIGNPNVNSGKNLFSLLSGGGQRFRIENQGVEGGNPYVDFQGEQDGGMSGTSDYYFKWSIGYSGNMTEYMRLSTTGLTGSNLYWKANKIAEIYGGTNQSSYTTGDILYASASNTLSKLTIGSAGKVLKVVGGVPAWATESTTDLTTATNFGTAVSGGNTIKLGNSAGTSQTTNLELYTSATLKLYNTSNVNVATFTPVSNTCNLDLKGGVISLATMGSNTTWNGNVISPTYGGTGLTFLTANKILQVNSSGTAYNFVDMPSSATQYWSESGSILAPLTNTNVIRGESGFRVGSTTDYTDIDYNTSTDTFSLYSNQSNKTFFQYEAGAGFITWGDQSGIMDFNNYVLATKSIRGKSNINNFINEDPNYGWKIYGNNSTYLLNFYNGSSYFPYFGSTGSGNGIIHTHINGITGGNPWVVDNTDNTAGGLRQTFIGNDSRFASSRIGLGYSSSYGRIYNPSGTQGANTNAGSHIHYHDNGTALLFNLPNTTYASTNSNNFQFLSGFSKRVQLNGSENPAIQLFQTNGSTVYGNIGRASTFPSNFGQWSSVAVPSQIAGGGTVMYMGGANTNDGEGFFFANSGNSAGLSNPGDNNTLWWFDEDNTGGTYWAITPSGTFTTSSDRRIKDNINTFKNSDFEKYKQIRTITYTQKKPDNLNPERLKKQSCIDKYNKIHYGVVAQELYDIYPELEDTKDREKWEHRRDNWDNGVYEEEHNKWLKEKEKYECDVKEGEEKCEYKQPEPQKEFNEEEPIRNVEYQRLSLLTIGVVQDLITENEKLKEEVNTYKQIIDKLVKAPSFKAFKESLA